MAKQAMPSACVPDSYMVRIQQRTPNKNATDDATRNEYKIASELLFRFFFCSSSLLLSSLIRHIFEDVPSRQFRVYFHRSFCVP